MNNAIVVAAAFAIGAISSAHILKKKHSREVHALVVNSDIERYRTFTEAYSDGYRDGEVAAVIEYAHDKYDELKTAQKKREEFNAQFKN
jgi:hypothetical protein